MLALQGSRGHELGRNLFAQIELRSFHAMRFHLRDQQNEQARQDKKLPRSDRLRFNLLDAVNYG
jgi:hypothetical protein